MASTRELANKIMEYMVDNPYWMETAKIMQGVGYGHRPSMLKLLHRLAQSDRLQSYGTGKIRWRLKDENWDRQDPLAGSPEPGDDDREEPVEETPVETPAPAPHGGPKPADPNLVSDLLRRVNKLESEIGRKDDALAHHMSRITDLAAAVAEAKKLAEASCKVIKVEKWDGSVVKLKDVVLPSYFQRVIDLAKCRRNILLVGPAGCGKSHLAGLVSDSLGLEFGSVSCTSGMSEAHLLGREVPDISKGEGRFRGTDFLKCYEDGGLYLLDELDAADPNLLLCVNSALANRYCNVPNRPKKPRAVRHKDFVCVATANTFGRGATRMYSGRNQLDEATLDRFRIGIVECYYDEAVERTVCPDETLRNRLQGIRRGIERCGLRRIMSTRFLQDAYVMKQGAGWEDAELVEAFFSGWPEDEKSKVLSA